MRIAKHNMFYFNGKSMMLSKSMKISIFIAALSTLLLTLILVAIHSKDANALVPPTTLGQLSYQKYDIHQLTSKSKLLVNVANGNLILQTNEINIKSVGPSLDLTRYFNDRATSSGQNGSHGTFGLGKDVSIKANSDGSATYKGPSGIEINFPSNGSGGYNVPASYNSAKLTTNTGGGWKLTFNKSGEYFVFDTSGKQVKYSNVDGQSVDYVYNSDGTLATATDVQGHVLYFTNYNGANVGKVSDNTGRYVAYTYDNGQLTSSQDAMGKTWKYQYYDTRGNINQIVDPRGYTTTLTYDNSNRVASIKYNDYTNASAEWTYMYDNNNSKTVVKDPLGHNTTYTYDGSGRVTQMLNAVGSTNGATWDANNNQTAKLDPSNYATTSSYDSLNNLTSVKNPALANGNPGASTTYSYSNSSKPYLPSSQTSAEGNVTSYSYNTNGNLSSSSTGSGTGAVSVTYKRQGDLDGSNGTINCSAKSGQVCSSADGNGNITSYVYDSIGNVVTIDHPGPVSDETFTYDNLSRVSTYTDSNGSKVTNTYDNMDRIIDKTWAKDNSKLTYVYDDNGNLTQQTGGSGQVLFTYDGFNRTTKYSQQNKPDINYTYDNVGNLKTEQGSAGTVTYGYDDANQITNVNQSSTNTNYSLAYTDGRPTSVTIPGGITQTISYDRAGRQTSIKAIKGSAVLTDYSATYTNSSGNDRQLLQSEKNNSTGVTTTYSYDSLDRLISANGSAGTGTHNYTYKYDNNGNRTQTSKDGTYSAIQGFNAANELTTSGGAAYGTYDNAGNQTSNGSGMSFSYNAKNQTSSITPAGSSTNSANYQDQSQSLRTSFGPTDFSNGLQGLYSQTSNSNSTYYTHLPSGSKQTIYQLIGSAPYYYLTDIHGSTVAMTDGSGNVVNTYSYDPYGTLLTATGSTQNAIKYENGFQDQSTGLYKFGARYYNATEARWTQTDPSKQDNGYIYAKNNPVNYSDPSGLFSFGGALKSAGAGCLGILGYEAGAATIAFTATASGASIPTFAALAGSCAGGAVGGVFVYSLIGNNNSNDYILDAKDSIERYVK